jgi:uncharacterized protein (DUF4415 family)
MADDVEDHDNPEWTDADFARAKPATEVLPAAFIAEARRGRGRPRGSLKAEPKQRVTLRLDKVVVDRFRATGAGWQSRINAALRQISGA